MAYGDRLEAFDSNGTLILHRDRVQAPSGDVGTVFRIHEPGRAYVVWDSDGAPDTVISADLLTVLDREPDAFQQTRVLVRFGGTAPYTLNLPLNVERPDRPSRAWLLRFLDGHPDVIVYSLDLVGAEFVTYRRDR